MNAASLATRLAASQGKFWVRAAICLVLIGVGLAWRFAWMISGSYHLKPLGEAVNVAAAFAQTGTIAEAHGPGTGLTAHLNPIMPVVAGYVSRAFGTESLATAWILSSVALAIIAATALLFMNILAKLGVGFWGRVPFLAAYMLLPLFPSLEVVGFRHWEGGIALLLAATTLLMLATAQAETGLSLARSGLLSVAAAALLFVSPPLGVAGYICGLILLFRKEKPSAWTPRMALAVVALALVLAPWTVRNWRQFDRFIPLRSNFGLELAIAFHPEAASTNDANGTFQRRLASVHPLRDPDAVGLLKREGGEAGYAKRIGREAQAWMGDHPADTARLLARYGSQYYFPSSWFWSGNSKSTLLKQVLMWLVSLGGLIAAVFAIRSWRGGWTYLGVFAIVPSIPYFLVQPILRYYYIVYPTLLLLGLELLRRVIVELSRHRRMRTQPHSGNVGGGGIPAGAPLRP